MSFTRQPGTVNELSDALSALANAFGSPVELTEVDDSTVDTTYGQEEADVLASLVVAVGEIQSFLSDIGFATVVEPE